MRWSTDSLSPAEISFQMSAIDCSRKARAERMPTSAWARLVCTTALSRSGLFLPRGILFFATSTKLSRARTGDAQRHAGEAHLVAGHRRHAVERARLAAFLLGLPRDHVARDRMVGRHEMVGERELVARRAAQADHVPDVGPFDLVRCVTSMVRSSWRPFGPEPRRAVGLADRAMRAEPGGMPAARGEGPYAGDFVAALAFDRLDPRAGPPGQHGARVVAEDRPAPPAGRDRRPTWRSRRPGSGTRRCWRRRARWSR